ncbi:PsbP-related protein [Oceanithermus desulfurans]
MKRLVWTLALLTCAVTTAAAPARTTFPDAGFSIQTLEAPPESGSYLVLMMFLPPEQGFQPNVNVMVQTYDGTIADYLQLTLKQFEQLGYRTLRSGLRDGRTVYVEYSGRFQGRAMHWYAVAVANGRGRVYLTTATATEAQWPALADRLTAVVDSFRLEGR